MKKFNLIVCFLAIMMCFGTLQAQDIHFSQYNASPLTLNPAQTGNFNCTFRGGINYRNQWASIESPYVTYSGFFDMPVDQFPTLDDEDRFGAGVYLFNDRSGEGTLSNFQATLTGAYHKHLGDQNYLSLGIGIGFMQKQLDQTNLIFGNQWDGDNFDTDGIPSNETFSGDNLNNINLDAGLMFKSQPMNELYYEAGVAVYHLTSPKESFLGDTENKLDMRYTGHARAVYNATEEFAIMPSILYQNQASASEFIGGVDFGYLIKGNTFQTTVFAGAHYRFDDAVIAQIGFDYKNFRAGFSYDITTSSLSDAASGVGGFEISLIYKACLLPVIPKEYVMPCPRY